MVVLSPGSRGSSLRTDVLPQATSRTRICRNHSRTQIRTQVTCRFPKNSLFLKRSLWTGVVAPEFVAEFVELSNLLNGLELSPQNVLNLLKIQIMRFNYSFTNSENIPFRRLHSNFGPFCVVVDVVDLVLLISMIHDPLCDFFAYNYHDDCNPWPQTPSDQYIIFSSVNPFVWWPF